MAISEILNQAVAGGMFLSCARFVAVEGDGSIRVRLASPPGVEMSCDVLQASRDGALPLRTNEEVLVACPAEPGHRAVLIGAIGLAPTPAAVDDRTISEALGLTGSPQPTEAAHRVRARQIIIEAGEELTLQCGEASIRITRNGKIVIRGEHVLSRAKGTNRIKGGTVAIN